jgi:hypothetical protein
LTETELYWLNKSFIAEGVKERGQQQEAIFHKLDLMDKKFEAVCRAVYDIDIIMTDPEDVKPNLVEVAEPTQDFEGTPSNPIMIYENIEEKEDTQW